MRSVEVMYVLAEAEEPVTALKISIMSGDTECTVKKYLLEWDEWVCKSSDNPPKFSPSVKLKAQLEYENFIRSANVNLKSIREQISDNLWADTFE